MSEDKYAPGPDRNAPPQPDAKYEPSEPKTGDRGKPSATNQGAQLAKARRPDPTPVDSAPASQVMNPSYVNALHYLEKYFRQQGELAGAIGKAADDGLAAFKVRSSHDYNKSSDLVFELFNAALKIIPAGAALGSAFRELQTGRKLLGLASTMKAVASAEASAESARSAKEAIEPVKKLYEAGEAVSDVGESKHAGTEARRAGDFEIQTLTSLTQLTASELATNWHREDFMDSLLIPLQFSPATLDLFGLTKQMLGALPAADTLAADLASWSDAFEVDLYLRFYLEDGEVTYVTTEREDVTIREFRGMPRAVVERLRETNNLDRVLAHPKLKHEHHVHRFEGMKV